MLHLDVPSSSARRKTTHRKTTHRKATPRKATPRKATPRRTAAAAITAIALVAATALPAAAHVSVSPDSLPKGATAELTFRVPNEGSSATTTQVRVQIPTDHPIAQVLPKQIPGWTVTVKTTTLATPLKTDDGTFTTAVSEVDWTGGNIPVGQYEDFQISVDPLPKDTGRLVFKAVQTYSDGTIVRWIDLPEAGQPGPDHPAPVLTLTAAESAGAGTSSTGSGAAAAADSAAAAAARSSGGSGSDTAGIVLGALGLAAGLAALALTLLSRRRTES
ncbi:YcnI family protein [Actinocrinis puniceicyclus]|uniref:YcnI family protein n=2 Tax=Actinocrinis puniceicyclus TaxID=977794 RepID=A0A8J7WKD4_9ACTN|nr:YcnI family protein [Actinocrinis puniceicyclus]